MYSVKDRKRWEWQENVRIKRKEGKGRKEEETWKEGNWGLMGQLRYPG